ncbi:Vesicle coat complex COPII subunit SEC13 protein [Dioscorea alata]|uniref:Vesicle coat complex COPII subunit SEC13 protein n=1 Tax=Dioscorea alata TaxID=55571 RepID=A0ACB7UBD9_DIOAL|nr:Vesicle coat complex COPII subunit SEC13 protein [Dioscorea alata]
MDGSEEDSGLDRSLNSRGGADKISCVRRGSSSSFLSGRRRSAWEISLREWLDRPGRPVDMLECLHVFQQVVDVVGVAHSQGVVLATARPSCFVVSSFNRVAFVESVSCSSSGSESCGRRPGSVLDAQVEDGRKEVGRGGWPRNAVSEMNDFPMKRMLVMELDWYTSPEEVDGCAGSLASDVYRLGVLLFELFCMFNTLDEKLRTMANLRHRVLPPQLLLKWPKVASFCLWLLHPQPSNRPKMSEVLQSEFLNETRDSLEQREAALKLKEEIEDQELLLEFLLELQQRKQETANKLHDTICFLSADIEEVVNRHSALKEKGSTYMEVNKACYSEVEKVDHPLCYSAVIEDSAFSGSRKRSRPELEQYEVEDRSDNLAEGFRSETVPEVQEDILSKNSRLMKNFTKLEAAYFSSRCRLLKPGGKFINKKLTSSGTGQGSIARTEVSSIDDLLPKEACNTASRSGWIDPFLEGLCKYLSYSRLKVRADLKQGDLLNSSNLVCSLGFDRDKEFFATAGVNRKIKVFECNMILNEERDIHYPVIEMGSGSKVSSICWNSYIKNQIASSDFEGVVQVWDVTRSQVFAEFREHERRVWSVDFSVADPTKLASGSDDGSVKLWNINQGGSIGTIRTKANICSVQFPPESSRSLAIGSADHNIYFYDLRNVRLPWCTLVGHSKTVSYVKFVDSSTLVSASTDNSLKLWDLSGNVSRVHDTPLQTFTGHTNIKNFVGLSIYDGYIATGSETNEIFVYHKAFPMPVLSYKFETVDPITGREVDDTSQFISCVCWRGQSSMLVAANSSGNIKLLEMV